MTHEALPKIKIYSACATVGSFVLLVSGWWFYWYTPGQHAIACFEKQISDYVHQGDQHQALAQEVDQLDTYLKQMRLAVANEKEDMPISSAQSALAYLFDQARKHDVVCTTCTTENEEKKDWYMRYKLALNLSGNLGSLLSFFDTLKQSKTLMQAKTVSLTKSNDIYQARTSISASIV